MENRGGCDKTMTPYLSETTGGQMYIWRNTP